MNKLRKLFHIHDFEKVKFISCSFLIESIFSSHTTKVNGTLFLEKCKKEGCEVLRAYITEGTIKEDVDLDFIASKLGKEWLKV